MKKIIAAFLFTVSFLPQYAQHTAFKKTTENRYSSIDRTSDKTGNGRIEIGKDNVSGKSGWEKILFGPTHAEVEFSVEPSFEGAYGLRLRRTAQDSAFVLETVRISNWNDVEDSLNRKFPTIGIPLELMTPSFPEDIVNLVGQHNRTMLLERDKERKKPDLYETSNACISIDERFARKLQAEFAAFIDRFEGGELPAGELTGDGEYTTFRTVAGNELRTLRIDFKTENEARTLSDLCKRMIADIEAGCFDRRELFNELSTNGRRK